MSIRLNPSSNFARSNVVEECDVLYEYSLKIVPRFEAKMTRIQYKGSDEADDMIPYSGTREQTKKIRSVTAVHSIV